MGEQAINAQYTLSTKDVHARDQRIKTFIIVLALMDVPFALVGIFYALTSHPNAVLTLMLSFGIYLYLGIYYFLLRRGYGVLATYIGVLVFTTAITVGVHYGGGFPVVNNAIYLLVIVSIGLILNEPRALDFAMVCNVLGYGGLVFYQLATPTETIVLLQTRGTIWLITMAIVMLVTILGTWILMRQSVVTLRRSNSAQQASQHEAETRADENATLLQQIQTSNAELLTTQAQLRETVDALALPLIPLEDGVVLLPLVGYLDQARADRMVERLLHGIHENRARTVIVDITGLREVDDQIAETLLQVAHSSRLLGAQVVLSGVGADAARALVARDADLEGLRTTGRLRDALQMAIQQTRVVSERYPKTNGFSFES